MVVAWLTRIMHGALPPRAGELPINGSCLNSNKPPQTIKVHQVTIGLPLILVGHVALNH